MMSTQRDNGRPHTAAASRRQDGVTLVELLVVIAISSIVMAMVLMTWFALNNAYFFSVKSADARDSGRQALSRMERELRDVEAFTTTASVTQWQNGVNQTYTAIVQARPYTVVFPTTFNLAGNESPTKAPRLVMYRLYMVNADEAELWRFEDKNNDYKISGVTWYPTDTDPTDASGRPAYALSERTTGEGARRLMGNVVNVSTAVGTPKPLFEYGGIYEDTMEWRDRVVNANNRDQIVSVKVRLMVDLNPKRAPIFADMIATAQMRNLRRN